MRDNPAQNNHISSPEVFISYASRDQERIFRIAEVLEAAGVSLWLDRSKITGGTYWSEQIVQGIKNCKLMMLMCSDASMRSRNVKAEIQLAWRYEKLYLPLLLEDISFPEQIEYFLEGWQWIEVKDHPEGLWLPKVLETLRVIGAEVKDKGPAPPHIKEVIHPQQIEGGLASLRALAKFTDLIWPVPAEKSDRAMAASTRGLGAPQDDVQHGFPLGSRVRLVIESDRTGHLTLLDEGPEGILYCLCPSWFAPETTISKGKNVLPQKGARYDSFVVTGKPGREQLLALITDKPLGLDWIPSDTKIPAHVLNQEDIETVLAKLRRLEGNRWTAFSTYFDVLA